MKNKHLIILLVLWVCPVIGIYAQQMHIDWLISAGGTGTEVVKDMCIAPNGEIQMLGYYNKTHAINKKLMVPKGGNDLFISRYDTEGKPLSTISIGGGGDEIPAKIIQGDNGHSIVAFMHYKDSRIGKKLIPRLDTRNLCIAWIDEKGNSVREFQFSCSKKVKLTDMITTTDGQLVISGYFDGMLKVGDQTFQSKNNKSAFLIKLTQQAKSSWAKVFNGKGNDQINAIYITPGASIHITGKTQSGCFDNLKFPYPMEKDVDHLFYGQLDSTGKVKKVRYLAQGEKLEATSLIERNGMVWLGAKFSRVVNVDGKRIVSRGLNDILLMTINPQDNKTGYKRYGGIGNDIPVSFSLSKNYLMMTGIYSNQLEMEGHTLYHEQFGADVFVASIGANDSISRVFTIEGGLGDFPGKVMADETGVYVAGAFQKELEGEQVSVKSKGGNDLFLARYENCDNKKPVKIELRERRTGNQQMFELDAGDGYISYWWNKGVAMGKTFQTPKPGEYMVEVSDNKGCFFADSIIIDQDKSIETYNGLAQLNSLKVYPTITNRMVYWSVNSTEQLQNMTLEVTDVTGREIIYQKEFPEIINGVIQSIDLGAARSGTYFLRLYGGDIGITRKIILHNK